MAEFKQLEFYLLRYVPIAVRDEFVNIGLILIEPDRTGFGEVRFTPDWRVVERLDPQVDIEMLQAIERYIRTQFQEPATRGLLLKKMEDSFSNLVRLSTMHTYLAEDPGKEVETLASFYFKTIHQPAQRAPSGRNWIWQQMRAAFEQEGILGAIRTDVAMEQYTRPGDRLKLDFAYTLGEELKIFQAVTLKGKLEPAKYFGLRAPGIVEVLTKKAKAIPLLTALVEDDWNRDDSEVRYAFETMAENRVAVAVVADMPKIAQRARIELKL